jgi:hypothetical protein
MSLLNQNQFAVANSLFNQAGLVAGSVAADMGAPKRAGDRGHCYREESMHRHDSLRLSPTRPCPTPTPTSRCEVTRSSGVAWQSIQGSIWASFVLAGRA